MNLLYQYISFWLFYTQRDREGVRDRDRMRDREMEIKRNKERWKGGESE